MFLIIYIKSPNLQCYIFSKYYIKSSHKLEILPEHIILKTNQEGIFYELAQ